MSFGEFLENRSDWRNDDVSFVSLDFMVSCTVFDFLQSVFRTCRTRATLTLLYPETEKMHEIRTRESVKLSPLTLFTMQNNKRIKYFSKNSDGTVVYDSSPCYLQFMFFLRTEFKCVS
jgi:hypothetical protein